MYKSKLQELCHQNSWNLPEYTTVKDGPDHSPRFTATVAVNGVPFQTPTHQCRSSKDAQNQAAKLALDHFTAPKTLLQHPQNSTANASNSSSSSGFPTINNLDNRPANSGIVQLPQQENVQILQVNEIPLGFEDDKRSKDKLHLYKSRLQNYAQKKNLALPMYSSELNGPPHARRFKSRVTIDGKTYEAVDFFPTLKEAEHAAAKVAFESLSLDEIQEDGGLYKSLLQELAQKKAFRFPVYGTAKSGPPHMPTFVSTVEVGNELFQGQEAKTKKQAEMNAAKAAYIGLAEFRAGQNPTVLSPGGHMKGVLEVSSSSFQSIVTDELQPNIRRSVTADLQPKVRPKSNLLIKEEQPEKDKDINAKRCKCSSDSVYAHLRDPFPSITSSPEDGPSLPSTPAEYSTNSATEPNIETAAGGTLARRKVLVCAHKPNMTYPHGATVLPYSDDKWMALEVDIKHNQ